MKEYPIKPFCQCPLSRRRHRFLLPSLLSLALLLFLFLFSVSPDYRWAITVESPSGRRSTVTVLLPDSFTYRKDGERLLFHAYGRNIFGCEVPFFHSAGHLNDVSRVVSIQKCEQYKEKMFNPLTIIDYD